MSKCSICGKDTMDKEPLIMARKLVNKYNLIAEMVNPGGRSLEFDFGKIQLHEECFWCDYENIKSKIEKVGKEKIEEEI